MTVKELIKTLSDLPIEVQGRNVVRIRRIKRTAWEPVTLDRVAVGEEFTDWDDEFSHTVVID